MSEDEVRALVRERALAFAGSRAGSTGVIPWGKAHGVHQGALSLFMAGKRPPPADLLHALGLEWRIVRKASPQGAADTAGGW